VAEAGGEGPSLRLARKPGMLYRDWNESIEPLPGADLAAFCGSGVVHLAGGGIALVQKQETSH